jgi:protein subunit release factor A
MGYIPADQLEFTVNDPAKKGGQHVGTYSGITVTHIPTGITVTVETERSQHRNKAVAIDALMGALTSPMLRGSY